MTDEKTQAGPDDIKNAPEEDTEGHRMARPDVNALPGPDGVRNAVPGPDGVRNAVPGPDESK
jgi:hypothetical protein